jgi:hypothetical protein
VDLLWTQAGVRDVPLPAGGSLHAKVVGKPPSPPAKVALRCYRGADRTPAAEVAMADGRIDQIDGLPVGEWNVRLELGEWFREPRVLGRTRVAIEGGRTTEVELKVTAEIAMPAKVQLRGILAIPAEWHVDRRDVQMELDPLRGTDRWAERQYLRGGELARGATEGEYQFVFRGVYVGRYAITVHPGNHRQLIQVQEDSRDELRVELSPPIDVVVKVVDGVTRQPRKDVSLCWQADFMVGVGGSPESVQPAPDSNEVRFRAAAGRIWVSASGDGFEVPHQMLQVGPDAREFEVATQPLYGVKLVLYEGNEKLPTTGWDYGLRPVEGEAGASGWCSDGTLTVRKPGIYVLTVKGPDGYQAVAERQVKVTTIPFPVIEVKVARK